MRRILLKHGEVRYRFLQYELRDNADGSLYLIFDKKPSPQSKHFCILPSGEQTSLLPKKKSLKISYHTSGRVNFNNGEPPIFCEPLFEITQYQPLFFVHLPDISRLDVAEKDEADDFLISVDDLCCAPFRFGIAITPFDFSMPVLHSSIKYRGLFDIKVLPGFFPEVGGLLETNMKTHTIEATVNRGPFEEQCINKYQALISFHKKKTGIKEGMIGYWNPTTGVYRFIFCAEMFCAPDVCITFKDPRYSVKIKEKTPAEIRFRVSGPGGFILDRQIEIESITLEAEL